MGSAVNKGGREWFYSADLDEFSSEVRKACCHLMSSARLPVNISTSLPDNLLVIR